MWRERGGGGGYEVGCLPGNQREGEREREEGRGLFAKCVDHNLLPHCFLLSFLLSLPSPPLSPLPPPLSYPPSSSALPPFLQDYYKIGVVTCPSSESIQELREACDYLMIPFSEKTIRSQNLCKLAQEYVLVIHKRY